MNIKEFIGSLTNEKIEERASLNDITTEEFNEFCTLFNAETEENKIEYITAIIDNIDETDLVSGKYQIFFDNDDIKALLRRCV